MSTRSGAVALGVLLLGGAGALAILVRAGELPALGEALDRALGADSGIAALATDASTDAALDAGRKRTRPQAAPLSSAQLGEPLVSGGYVTACGAPAAMKVVVKVTVKMGRATEVEVTSDPPDTAVADCVRRAIGEMRWDASLRSDHVTVRY